MDGWKQCACCSPTTRLSHPSTHRHTHSRSRTQKQLEQCLSDGCDGKRQDLMMPWLWSCGRTSQNEFPGSLWEFWFPAWEVSWTVVPFSEMGAGEEFRVGGRQSVCVAERRGMGMNSLGCVEFKVSMGRPTGASWLYSLELRQLSGSEGQSCGWPWALWN